MPSKLSSLSNAEIKKLVEGRRKKLATCSATGKKARKSVKSRASKKSKKARKSKKSKKSKKARKSKKSKKSKKSVKSHRRRTRPGLALTSDQLDSVLYQGADPVEFNQFQRACNSATVPSIKAWAQDKNHFIDHSLRKRRDLCKQIYATNGSSYVAPPVRVPRAPRVPVHHVTVPRASWNPQYPLWTQMQGALDADDVAEYNRICKDNISRSNVRTFGRTYGWNFGPRARQGAMCDGIRAKYTGVRQQRVIPNAP